MIVIQSFSKAIKTTWITKYIDTVYIGVVSALKSLWNVCRRDCNTNTGNKYESFPKTSIHSQKFCRLVHKRTYSSEEPCPDQTAAEQNKNETNWSTVYMLAYYCSKSKKIREFQFIFLHRRLPANYFLGRIGLKESVKYSFCNEDPESLNHLLWSCWKTTYFWDRLKIQR